MSLEEHKRRERAQAIGLFRYQLICPALDAGLSTKQRASWAPNRRGYPYRSVRQPGAGLAGDAGPLDSPLPRWWVRSAATRAAAAGRPHGCAGAGAGGLPQTGKPDPHRHPGGSHPAHRHRVGALGVHPAAPFPPARADGTLVPARLFGLRAANPNELGRRRATRPRVGTAKPTFLPFLTIILD